MGSFYLLLLMINDFPVHLASKATGKSEWTSPAALWMRWMRSWHWDGLPCVTTMSSSPAFRISDCSPSSHSFLLIGSLIAVCWLEYWMYWLWVLWKSPSGRGDGTGLEERLPIIRKCKGSLKAWFDFRERHSSGGLKLHYWSAPERIWETKASSPLKLTCSKWYNLFLGSLFPREMLCYAACFLHRLYKGGNNTL